MRVSGALLFAITVTTPSVTALSVDKPRNAKPMAVFTTSTDDDFLRHIITGFSIMKDVNAESKSALDYFVGGKFSIFNKNLLKKHGIKVLDLDVKEFKPHCDDREDVTRWLKHFKLSKSCLPAEAHWWSAVPEILASQGYELSMYMDAADVVAMKPLNVSEVRRKFLETGATLATAPRGSKKGEFIGDKINTGVIMFNNTAMKATGFYGQYADFFKKYADQATIQARKCEACKVEDLKIEWFGQKSGSQYLEMWQRSEYDKPVNVKFSKLEPEYQMMCAADHPLTVYYDTHPAIFVHLRDECHIYINPIDVQRGVPRDAKEKWNLKAKELFGDQELKLKDGTWFR